MKAGSEMVLPFCFPYEYLIFIYRDSEFFLGPFLSAYRFPSFSLSQRQIQKLKILLMCGTQQWNKAPAAEKLFEFLIQ
jgi:hypothetical protein